MNNQQRLALQFVEELRKLNALEDVICEWSLETVRECNNCHKLMNEGWIYDGRETYCSDKCLLAVHPEEDLKELKKHASDEDSDTFWTAWGK